jgi:hypothetical protein
MAGIECIITRTPINIVASVFTGKNIAAAIAKQCIAATTAGCSVARFTAHKSVVAAAAGEISHGNLPLLKYSSLNI